MKKYIQFDLVEQRIKTSIWAVRNIKSQMIIGYIKWKPTWRQYTFEPLLDTVYSKGCLQDIIDFIGEQG